MKTEDFEIAIEAISMPLDANEIEWRVQGKAGNNTVVVPYIKNRAVMNRLDKYVGCSNWRNEYIRWGERGVLCGLSIRLGEDWLTKWDGADETQIEATKGGLSDSMKRAAVQWGMGRDLYEYPKIMIEGEHKYIPWEFNNMLEMVTTHFQEGKIKRDVYTLKLNQNGSK